MASHKRIYVVTFNDATHLVRAASQAEARSCVARSAIQVSVATGEQIYALAASGHTIVETGKVESDSMDAE